MSFLDQIGEELQEEREHQQTDVHTIHIGIGGDDDFVVPQFIESVLYVQSGLQTVELFVLVHHGFAQPVAVERFTAKGEDSLSAHVTALGDRTGCRETLGDEDTGL